MWKNISSSGFEEEEVAGGLKKSRIFEEFSVPFVVDGSSRILNKSCWKTRNIGIHSARSIDLYHRLSLSCRRCPRRWLVSLIDVLRLIGVRIRRLRSDQHGHALDDAWPSVKHPFVSLPIGNKSPTWWSYAWWTARCIQPLSFAILSAYCTQRMSLLIEFGWKENNAADGFVRMEWANLLRRARKTSTELHQCIHCVFTCDHGADRPVENLLQHLNDLIFSHLGEPLRWDYQWTSDTTWTWSSSSAGWKCPPMNRSPNSPNVHEATWTNGCWVISSRIVLNSCWAV